MNQNYRRAFMMNLHSFTAVCFDFDGTLVDNFDGIAHAVNHVRAARGLPALSTAQVKPSVGRGIDYLVAHTVPGGNIDENIARYREHFPKVMREGMTLLPGAREVLAALQASGKRLALCSNKLSRFSRALLEDLQIADYFSAVLGPEDCGKHKPAPDMLLVAMQKLGVTPEQTLYIGDMVVDIQTARAAGVAVWVVPTGTEEAAILRAAGPDRLLTDLHEVVRGS